MLSLRRQNSGCSLGSAYLQGVRQIFDVLHKFRTAPLSRFIPADDPPELLGFKIDNPLLSENL